MPAEELWCFTDDVETFAAHVWDLLRADPARNTVALTVIETVRAGRRWSEEPMLFGWYGEPAVAAVLLTPPHHLHLAQLPEVLVDPLVGALRDLGVRPPGVNGETVVVDAFVTRWTSGHPSASRIEMRTRLYALDRLRPPDPLPPGRARRADEGDVELATAWCEAFDVEAGTVSTDAEAAVRDQVAGGRLWLWEDAAGRTASLAGRHRSAAGVARVGPVYTPPAHRRRGYGTAVTAAVTEDALREEVDGVVLFTDLANPTSNSIYQQIGYRPVRDQSVVGFGKA